MSFGDKVKFGISVVGLVGFVRDWRSDDEILKFCIGWYVG